MLKTVGLYNTDGLVVNRIVIDTEQVWTPPAGVQIIDDENANIGDTVVDGVLVPQPEPEEES